MVPAIVDFDPAIDTHLLKLAREIAIDHYPIEAILKKYSISADTWSNIRQSYRFVELLQSETAAWGSALNTKERVKLKAAAVVEEWLEEADQRIHDPRENLTAKVEVVKLLGRFGALDQSEKQSDTPIADRVTISINIGDQQIHIGGTATPEVAIEDDPVASFNWDDDFEPNPIPEAKLFFDYFDKEEAEEATVVTPDAT